MPQLGLITLNISSTIYLIWLIPQIIHNFRRKDTEGLSMLMHGILFTACLSDLMYGFGTGMQWQYRMVSIVTLCGLMVQHYQIGCYGLHRVTEKKLYGFLSILFCLFFLYAFYVIQSHAQSRSFYDLFGMIANIGFLSYTLPQVFKNYSTQSAVGLSIYFIFLSIFLNLCDINSAWMLNWDYPSKIGPIFTLTGNLCLLFQYIYYERRSKRLAVNC